MFLLFLFFLFFFYPISTYAETDSQLQSRLATEFQNLPCTPGRNANLTISRQNPNLNITISTDALMAGAITSLKLNGEETINSSDHGRELQFAFQINNQGEKNNPTEAGSTLDTTSSSSRFINGCTINNTLYTKTQMAYWYPHQNNSLSPYIMEKIVQIGIPGYPNVIRFAAKFHLNPRIDIGRFEIPTGYHNNSFSQISIYDIANKIIRPARESDFYINLWNIFDKAIWQSGTIAIMSNNTHSLAAYSPLSNKTFYGICQNVCGNHPTIKWSLSNYKPNISSLSEYYTEAFLIIDSPNQIQNTLTRLIEAHPQINPTFVPVGGINKLQFIYPNHLQVEGWVRDLDSPDSPVHVHFYLDKPAGNGPLAIASTTGNPVFTTTIALGDTLSPGQHRLFAYGIDLTGEGNPLIGSLTGYIFTPNYTLTPTLTLKKPGDVNNDNKVDLTDYSLWKEQFILGELGTQNLTSSADFNRDKKVNILDYSIWKQAYIDTII
jgi:hypothetical protein